MNYTQALNTVFMHHRPNEFLHRFYQNTLAVTPACPELVHITSACYSILSPWNNAVKPYYKAVLYLDIHKISLQPLKRLYKLYMSKFFIWEMSVIFCVVKSGSYEQFLSIPIEEGCISIFRGVLLYILYNCWSKYHSYSERKKSRLALQWFAELENKGLL